MPNPRFGRIASILGGPCLIVTLVSLMALPGCGTRAEPDSTEAAARAEKAPATPEAGVESGVPGAPNGPTTASPSALPATGSGQEGGPAADGGNPGRSVAAGSKTSSSPAAAPTGAQRGTPGSGPARAGKPGSGDAPAGKQEPRSPIIVASIGTYSGPVGGVTLTSLAAAQLWVKHINAKGGLNGHPVQLLVYDDGADANRGKAQAREAIEVRHVVAFLHMTQALVGAANVDYITSKRVPVIGLAGSEDWAFRSPMYFPQASTGEAFVRNAPAMAAEAMVPKGKTRFGVIVCVENDACGPGTQKVFAEGAQRYGYQLVFQARTSLAQPDFTSECLAARNANVQFLFVSLDPNSVRRVSAACARQGFRPILGMHSGIQEEKMKDEDLLEFISSSAVFPWFQSGTPATDEFQQVLRTYGKGLRLTGSMPLGWVSGKLLEKAATRLPEPPTSAAILAGLWSLKSETLGGLTMPLTFIENQPPKPQSCYFNVAVRNRSWASPDNFALRCLPEG